jgi:hypothetical protein
MIAVPLSQVQWERDLRRSGGTVRFRLERPAHSAASFPLIAYPESRYRVVEVDAQVLKDLLPTSLPWFKEAKSQALAIAFDAGEAFYPPLLEALTPGWAKISDGQHRIECLSWRGCEPYPVVVRESEASKLPSSLGVRFLGTIDSESQTFEPEENAR